MGRIVAQVKLANLADPNRTLSLSALVDTGGAYITLPNAWRESLVELRAMSDNAWTRCRTLLMLAVGHSDYQEE